MTPQNKTWLAAFLLLLSNALYADDSATPQLDITLTQWSVADAPSNTHGTLPSSDLTWQPMAQWTPQIWHLPKQKDRWFKAKFRIGWHYKTTPLAMTLGPLYSAAQVFINGIPVNATSGSDTERFRRSQTQVFPLPSHRLWYSFLDFQKDNELLIHLTSDKEPLTIDPDAILIDNYDSLALKAKDSDTLLKIAQGAMIGLLVSFGLFSAFLRAVGFKERENTLFGLFVGSVALAILCNSLLLPSALGVTLAHSTLPWLLTTISVFALAGLYSPTQTLPDFTKGMLLLNLLVLTLLAIEQSNHEVRQNLTIVCQLINIGVLLEATISKAKAWRSFNIEHIGIALLLVSAILQLFWSLDYSPVKPLELALFVVSFGLLFNVALRFKHMARSLLKLSNRLVSIREKERARLTRDIHDGVGQGLSTLKLLINLNAKKLEPELSEMLKSEVANTSTTLKSVIRNLKPIEVASGSPTQSIVSLAQHNCDLAKITLIVKQQDYVQLSQEHAYQVYRIAQEALNNAIKHSEADTITLTLEATLKHFIVTIYDNGKGVIDTPHHESYGMSSMKERSMIIGATLSIQDHISRGTVIRLEVPYHD